jgi:hypothetical protein
MSCYHEEHDTVNDYWHLHHCRAGWAATVHINALHVTWDRIERSNGGRWGHLPSCGLSGLPEKA